MDATEMAQYIAGFPHVESTTAFGYTFFFYRSERMLPFATLIDADAEHDSISNLDRPGVYRVNIGIGRETFRELFGPDPVDIESYDFTRLDIVMPHPEYAAQHFVCVLAPTSASIDQVKRLLTEAHAIAARRFNRRNKEEA
jgi:hypothetical protein